MTKVILFIGLSLLCIPSHAQVFPIQGNVQLLPPYSPYLTDLTAPASQRFSLQLRVNDPTLSDYTCKLRITIDGVGITLKTKPAFVPQPITLQGGGIPQTFYGEDVADYFNTNNLDFAGISKREFEKTNRLPEGVYRFTVEVLDYNRGTVVSNKIMTNVWIILNDPPLLNLPRNHSKLQLLDPTIIPFTWTPRHTGSPNAAFTTEYIFRLIELPPNTQFTNDQSAYSAFLNQPTLFETTLNQSQFIYGLSEPALLPGRHYAWQVQAKDIDGRDLFKNQGKTEVFVFQYGDALGIPQNLRKEGGNASTLSLRWDTPAQGDMPEQYRINYKPDAEDTWYETTTPNRWHTLGELREDTRYEVKIRSEKGKQAGEYTPLLPLNTEQASAQPYTCGTPETLPTPTQAEPLFKLLPGDKISSRKFKVLVTETTGSKGTFEGLGIMAVPFFNNASVRVKFHGQVNNAYELKGEIVSTYNTGNAMASVVEEMEKIGEERREELLKGSDTVALPVAITIVGVIDSVFVNDKGEIVVMKEDGTQEVIPVPIDEKSKDLPAGQAGAETVVLTDSAGNSYTISPNGTVTNNGTSSTTTVASNVSYTVTFAKDESQLFGFDQKEQEALARHYNSETISGSNYFIAWKAVAAGSFDKVKAVTSTQRAEFIKEIGFKSDIGTLPKLPGSNSKELSLTVQGRTHESVEEVTAYLTKKNADNKDTEETVGKLNIISYNKVYRTLVLVPVKNLEEDNIPALTIDATSLQQQLNDIYKQAAVQWTVRSEASLPSTYDSDNNGLEYGNSGLLSNYTGEMRTIINAYKNKHTTENDTYYLFITPKADDPQVSGYMPRKKQAGFIFTNNINSNPAKTIAHELAHGAFRLEHSFPELPENGNNLMDYSTSGTHLHKHQWDLVHDPVSVLGLFEGDEDAASKTLFDSKYVRLHDELKTTAWASNKGKDEFTPDIILEVDSKLEVLDKEEKKTFILINYAWFDKSNINKFEETVNRLSTNAKDKLGKELGISDFNLLVVVNAKYDTALAGGLRGVSFREWFYPMNGLDAACTKAVKDYLNDEAKKKFTDGLNEALKERAEKLLEKLKGCKVDKPKEIVIHYKRKGHNKYRTWGEFIIVGTDYKGYILERPKGTQPTTKQDFMRHPSGKFNLLYSSAETGQESKFWGVTMCLAEDTGYKLHGGDRADYSNGCFLINYNSPQYDIYPEAYDARIEDIFIKDIKKRRKNPDRSKHKLANSYYDHSSPNNPANKLRGYIESLESSIKEGTSIEIVPKVFIIDETEEKIDPL